MVMVAMGLYQCCDHLEGRERTGEGEGKERKSIDRWRVQGYNKIGNRVEERKR